MQFRFREYNEETDSYKLIAHIEVQDYDVMYRTLEYMRKNKTPSCLSVLNVGYVDSTNVINYTITDVSLQVSSCLKSSDSWCDPCFVVDIEEDF